MSSKLWAAVAGVVSAAVVLATAEVVAVFVGAESSPLFAVGSLAIDLAPPGVKDVMIGLFGTGDKAALLVILGIVVLALAAAAGLLEQRRPPLGIIVLVVVSGVAVLAVTTRAGATPFSAIPTVFGMIVGAVVLRLLISRLRTWELDATPASPSTSPSRAPAPGRAAGEGDEGSGVAGVYGQSPHPLHPQRPRTTPAPQTTPTTRVDRRRFLTATGIAAVAAVFAGVIARSMNATATAVSAVRDSIALPAAATKAEPVPAGAALDVDGITPYVTGNDSFYRIDTALQVPQVNADTWSLKITGMVEQEVAISFSELLALPLEEHLVTLACVSNEVGGDLIGNALWLGYPIRELLARAKPLEGADMVLSTSVDGFTAGSPLEALTDPDRVAMLAVGMNGEPLPVEHGFPVRMVVAGLYGYVSATKWVIQLEVTRFADAQGYWTPRGWSALGPIKTESRIDVPSAGASVSAGTVPVAGVAWAQHTGIAKVEVRIDDGDWQEARLAETSGPDTWVQWLYPWEATSGSHTLSVRATDASGYTQTSDQAPPAPDGATGWDAHSVTVN
ncbi:molybdopterin-dependent oxidoreductase [Herbiconiux sp. KACC 21604]|uniref:molybdopterin-dependent oxidoreductase n=1 Tax=unclassified Herbiconiux TaxID=2618217 RepID=UPI00149135AF|nr:molybdopterin-dependent oxidoreductase [Herbiconiux sp. SALV-R1]QJU55159.1 molybdopterin-dependent oxidoreductase [Herbiconiux sp. SALV-R1]WPO86314.1 molybdopterin-dependent oxidoreductase [Herbiconiux sp. KACC 21604]